MPSQFLTQYNTIKIMTILSVFFEVISPKHTRACSSLKRWPRSLQTAWHAVCRLHGHRAICRLHGAVCRLREVSRLHGTYSCTRKNRRLHFACVVSPSVWLVMSCSAILTTRSSSEVLRDSTNHANPQFGSTSCL